MLCSKPNNSQPSRWIWDAFTRLCNFLCSENRSCILSKERQHFGENEVSQYGRKRNGSGENEISFLVFLCDFMFFVPCFGVSGRLSNSRTVVNLTISLVRFSRRLSSDLLFEKKIRRTTLRKLHYLMFKRVLKAEFMKDALCIFQSTQHKNYGSTCITSKTSNFPYTSTCLDFFSNFKISKISKISWMHLTNLTQQTTALS